MPGWDPDASGSDESTAAALDVEQQNDEAAPSFVEEPSYVQETTYEEPSYEEPSYEEPSYEQRSYEEPSYGGNFEDAAADWADG